MTKRTKHKIRFSERLQYAQTWLANPTPLLAIPILLVSLALLFTLAQPCGRYDYPIHGHCASGQALISPGFEVIIALAASVIFIVVTIFAAPAPKDWNGLAILRAIFSFKPDPSVPKWHRMWSFRIFPLAYITSVVLVYLADQNAGLPWYDNAAQYLIVAPFFAWGMTQSALTVGRHVYLHNSGRL